MISPKSLKDKRFFRVKNARHEFLCALCSSPRQMRYSKNLAPRNYAQVFLLSITLMWLLFDFMREKVIFIVPVVLIVFEVVNKMLYRKEIPCPYCGFDATWYRRDVKMARSKVEQFWKENKQQLQTEEDVSIGVINDTINESSNRPAAQ